MQEEDFYLTLPGNSSMRLYDNTTTCFTTHLPREIRLNGDWRVCIAEIQVPLTIIHIREEDFAIQFNTDPANTKIDKTIRHKIGVGVYDNLQELLDEINSNHEIAAYQKFVPSKYKGGLYSIKSTCNCSDVHSMLISNKLKRILGLDTVAFKNPSSYVTYFEEKYTNDAGVVTYLQNTIFAPQPANLARGISNQLYEYTEISEPSTVGDTQTSLLRIANIDTVNYNYGDV